MKYSVVFNPKAEEEFKRAVWWYGVQQDGLIWNSFDVLMTRYKKLKGNQNFIQ